MKDANLNNCIYGPDQEELLGILKRQIPKVQPQEIVLNITIPS